jgi:hypothetical protein
MPSTLAEAQSDQNVEIHRSDADGPIPIRACVCAADGSLGNVGAPAEAVNGIGFSPSRGLNLDGGGEPLTHRE